MKYWQRGLSWDVCLEYNVIWCRLSAGRATSIPLTKLMDGFCYMHNYCRLWFFSCLSSWNGCLDLVFLGKH